ncbi:hypothetical protein MHLP_00810 [Candidatus Mycoplasma haematolamae str. Purdue]|uniref:Uncharacterized protein n=1 Tax=Mycoplasma haematolamae (strain Purdue) TaxID=1212765 RepID=I7C5F9_MYCHA|nr:hypothetical protein [Candidatus Mycoplasma haematolamae]AFO51742.1 hypothetical protein MHLP_00810 [Candidatus Mycoplasma haematolamae str. Purdue]
MATGGTAFGIYYLVKNLRGTTREEKEHIDHKKLSDIPGCSEDQCSEYCEHVLQCANQYKEQRGLPLECGFMCNDKIKKR